MERHNVISKKENIEFFFNSVKKRLEENIISLKKDINSRDIMSMQIGCMNSISYLLLLEKPKDEIYQYVYYALQFGVNHFKQALNPGKEIILEVGDAKVPAMGYKTMNYVDASCWKNHFRLAIILRDSASINFLKEVPEGFMKNAAIVSSDIDFAIVEIMKAFKIESQLSKAIKNYWEINATEVEMSITRKRFHEYLSEPFVKTIESIVRHNENEFNQNLEQALIKHKEFYTKGNRLGEPGDPFGWLSYNLISACCYAHDIGLKIEVESDYLPKWMIEGDFSGCELMVK